MKFLSLHHEPKTVSGAVSNTGSTVTVWTLLLFGQQVKFIIGYMVHVSKRLEVIWVAL